MHQQGSTSSRANEKETFPSLEDVGMKPIGLQGDAMYQHVHS